MPEGKEYWILSNTLGATTSNDYSSDNVGLYYQWGRKDPFVGAADVTKIDSGSNNWSWTKTTPSIGGNGVVKSETTGTIEYSIAHPAQFIYTTQTQAAQTTNDARQASWDWLNTADNYLWETAAGKKALYDPCPLGYKVAPYDMTLALIKSASTADVDTILANGMEYRMNDTATSHVRNVIGSFNQFGMMFYCGAETSSDTYSSDYVDLYPTNGRIEYVSNRLRIYGTGTQGRFWVSSAYKTVGCAHCVYIKIDGNNSVLQPVSTNGGKKATASPVRCVREDNRPSVNMARER